VPDDALIKWCGEDPESRSLFAVRISGLSEPTEDSPSLVNSLFRLAPDKPAFIAALADRCMSSGSSEREVAHMQIGLRILNALPVDKEHDVREAMRRVIDSVTQRIDWWQRIMEDTGRERAETFE